VCIYENITMKPLVQLIYANENAKECVSSNERDPVSCPARACPRNPTKGNRRCRKDKTEDKTCIKLGPGRLVCSDRDTPASWEQEEPVTSSLQM
jgi:hypothetical protein